MPQIWMTYDELGALCDCTASEARLQALHMSLDRRKSRDGNTRVKLNQALMSRFLASVREAEPDLDDAIAALRETHRQMVNALTMDQPGFRRDVA